MYSFLLSIYTTKTIICKPSVPVQGKLWVYSNIKENISAQEVYPKGWSPTASIKKCPRQIVHIPPSRTGFNETEA